MARTWATRRRSQALSRDDSGGGALIATEISSLQPNGEESSERTVLVPVSAAAGRWRTVYTFTIISSIRTDAHGRALFEVDEGSFLAFGAGGRLRARWHLQNPLLAVPGERPMRPGRRRLGKPQQQLRRRHDRDRHRSSQPQRPLPTRDIDPPVTATIAPAGMGTLFWADASPAGGPAIYAHAIAPGGPVIEVARGLPPVDTPER